MGPQKIQLDTDSQSQSSEIRGGHTEGWAVGEDGENNSSTHHPFYGHNPEQELGFTT